MREQAIEEWRDWWRLHRSTFKKRWRSEEAWDRQTRGGTQPMSFINREEDVPSTEGYRERVYEVVRRIPKGRVMTYGQIAEILGEGYTPRTVGFVMHSANEETTPWHRVINAQGGCSPIPNMLPPDKQQRMLESEGVKFDARSRCDLKRYRWTPEEAVETKAHEESQPSLFSE